MLKLLPIPYNAIKKSRSPILQSINTVWDIENFNIKKNPISIGTIKDKDPFNRYICRVLDMPIKLKGCNEYIMPYELQPFSETIQMIINHEHSILSYSDILNYYAYITIDQSILKK